MASGRTDADELWDAAREALRRRFAPTLVRAVNGTGVLLHTNLGRAPLPSVARAALLDAARGYSTVEYDPARGARGKRQDHVRDARPRPLRVRGRPRRQQQRRRGPARAGGARPRAERARLAGRARRDRRFLQDPGDPRGLGREAARGRHDEPDDGRRLSPRLRSRRRRCCSRCTPPTTRSAATRAGPAPHELALLAREAGVPWVHDHGTGAVVPLDGFGVPGRADGRRMPRRRSRRRDLLGRQAALGAAGRAARRTRRAGRPGRVPPDRARRAARQAHARRPGRDARRLEDGRMAAVPGLSRRGGDDRGARAARDAPGGARHAGGRARLPRRGVAGRVRRRDEPREALSVAGSRPLARLALGGGARRAAAIAAPSGRRARRSRTACSSTCGRSSRTRTASWPRR